jgi:pSer/pThr/pTyr-binding forkhead associated (FHA) protein
MAKLILKFEQSVLKEVAIGDRPVTVGRLPDNDLQVDNLAVSSHHARIYRDGANIVVEDLNSLNGTFVNKQRVTKLQVKPGDSIMIGKHNIEVHESAAGDVAAPAAPKAAAPKIEETVMMDSKRRKELLEAALAAQKAGAAGGGAAAGASPAAHGSPGAAPSSPVATPQRARVPWLVLTKGSTDQQEYQLTGKLTVIGKSQMASIKIKGFFARLFAPDVAAQINKRDDGYYLARAGQNPKVNGKPITSPTKLSEGDVIEIGSLTLNFLFKD